MKKKASLKRGHFCKENRSICLTSSTSKPLVKQYAYIMYISKTQKRTYNIIKWTPKNQPWLCVKVNKAIKILIFILFFTKKG